MGEGRRTLRPAIGTASFMAGLVLVLFALRWAALLGSETDREFVEGDEFQVWMLVAAASVLLWLVVLMRGRGVLRTLMRRAPEEARRITLRDWFVHGCGLAALTIAVVSVTSGLGGQEAPDVPIEHWRAITWVLLVVAGVAVLPWIVGVWMTHEQLQASKPRLKSLTQPGEEADGELERLRGSWRFIERAVLFLLAVVVSATVMTGALRVALVPEEVEESAFAASDVILYGAFFACVSAIVVLPLVASWRAKAFLLLDQVFPVTSRMTADQADARARLASALNLDVSMFRSPLTVLGVLSPLLTSVLAVFVPQLGK